MAAGTFDATGVNRTCGGGNAPSEARTGYSRFPDSVYCIQSRLTGGDHRRSVDVFRVKPPTDAVARTEWAVFLERVELTNFRCFETLSVPLHRHLNVFVGDNGSGKTTVLDAVALALAPILSRLPFEPEQRSRSVAASDIRTTNLDHLEPFTSLSATARSNGSGEIKWGRSRSRDLTALTRQRIPTDQPDTKPLFEYVERIIDDQNANRSYKLPVFAYYGTNRAVDVPHNRLKPATRTGNFPRLVGLDRALDPRANFRRTLLAFDELEQRELRDKRDKKIRSTLPALDAVRRAVMSMIPDISNPRIDGRTKRFTADLTSSPTRPPTRLTLDQLSDGYQVLLGVVMDFAARMVTCNPPTPRKDPLHEEAILIIDEVDLHLHPGWQQRIVPDLRRTFPNTQLILTTHSPQVLSTVHAESIRVIRADEAGKLGVFTPDFQTRGVESADVLSRIMGVDPVPKVEEASWLSNYRAMIEDGRDDSDEGRDLRARLERHFGVRHPLMLDCDRLLRFFRFKRQRPGGT